MARRSPASVSRTPSAPLLAETPVRARTRFGRLRAWLGNQPRTVRGSLFMIGMFAVINLLTNGLSEIWFVYPSIPFVFFLAVRGLGKRA